VIAEAALAILQLVTALPTSKVEWDMPTTAAPDRYEVRWDQGVWLNASLPPVIAETADLRTHAINLPTLVVGQHLVDVRACYADGQCSDPAALAFVLEQPAPVCADVPSVFVTRWEHTTGKPGSRMRVNFQLASISPIVEIHAEVDSEVVARITGTDLRDTAGVWFVTPGIGTHALRVFAKNAAGCSKEVDSLVPLVVK
jgi:hypothetical protein